MSKRKQKVNRITAIEWKQYRLTLLKDKTAKNLHHILSRKEKEYKVDDKKNKIEVPEIPHDNLNRFYWNRQMPHLQLKYMLEDWWRNRVLNKWVIEELYALLSLPREEFYDPSLVPDKHKWKELFSDKRIFKDTI